MSVRDPFKIEGPACISFSGGRTSAYMLWRVLQAHQWILPADIVVCFANTGKEMPETLDFVRDCSVHWNVPIVWIEYRSKIDGEKRAIVDHATASRNGEPFAALIRDKSFLPNPVTRFCTSELKIRPMHWYLRSLGWTAWDQHIGIRADEQRRVSKIRAPGHSTESKSETMCMPLADAGITKADVGEFWARQVFDLKLPNNNGTTMHGNCDLCFLKGSTQVLALIREKPERAVWWMEQEAYMYGENVVRKRDGTAFRFRNDRPSYAQMHRMALDHGELFPFEDEAIECYCGE